MIFSNSCIRVIHCFLFLSLIIAACSSKEITEYRTPHQIELAKIVNKYSKQYEAADYIEAKRLITLKAENTIDNFVKNNNYQFKNLKGIVVAVMPFYGYYKFQIRFHITLNNIKSNNSEYSSIIYSHTYSDKEPKFALTNGLAKGDTVIFSGKYLKFSTGKVALSPFEYTPAFAYANPEFSVDFTKVKKQ